MHAQAIAVRMAAAACEDSSRRFPSYRGLQGPLHLRGNGSQIEETMFLKIWIKRKRALQVPLRLNDPGVT